MSQSDKSALYNELKAAGVEFTKHYREYSTQELQEAVDRLMADPNYQRPAEFVDEEATPHLEPQHQPQQMQPPAYSPIIDEEPVKTEPNGIVWFREEVRKPASPAPRKRLVRTYLDTGVKKQKVTSPDGKYVDTVEVAGDRQPTTSQVKITLPSYQVGVYLDPRYPFKIHVYNNVKGFDFYDVCKFYGGADLVPTAIQRIYVGNDLCYHIQSVIRAIQQEHRDQVLKGRTF